MLDAPARRVLSPTLDAVGARLADAGVPALALTAAGWVAGLAACAAVLRHAWLWALALWLVNRLLDGLDRGRLRDRAADRGLARDSRLLALGVPDQHSDCRSDGARR